MAAEKPEKRWLFVAVGFILFLLLGLIYAWSIFVAPLERDFGWSRSETSLAFTICMCMFCIGGFVSGLLSKTKTPGLVLRLCAICVLIGFVLTSRIHTLTGLYIGYGGFVGVGVGLAYNAVISTVTKWFPNKAGLVSGILLMAFGFGGMVLGTVNNALMATVGWRSTFLGIGVVFFVIIACFSFILKQPSGATLAAAAVHPESKDFTTREMLAQSSFYLFFIWAVLLTAAGLALIGHASPIAMDMGIVPAKAALYVGFISIANGLGRVIVGAVFDKLGRRRTMTLVPIGFILSGGTLVAAIILRNEAFLIAGYICTGLSYGGIMPCNSTVTWKFFGRAHYSMNFSMITLNVLIASPLGPYLAGVLQEASHSYLTTFIVMAASGAAAMVLNFIIRQPK